MQIMGQLLLNALYVYSTKFVFVTKNVSKQLKDNVNSPVHYNSGKVECIEAIEAMLTPDEYIGYLRGNSFKYRWRFRYKGKPVEDLQKADWYEARLEEFLKKESMWYF